MRFLGVARAIGWLMLALAGATMLPVLAAISDGRAGVLRAFLIPGLAAAFLGGALIITTRDCEAINLRRDGLLVIAALWLVLPLWAAVPFLLSGAISDPVGAYFEAVSGLTTTGATVLEELTGQSSAIIVWRGLLQWLGGFATLLAWAILVAPDVGSGERDVLLEPGALKSGGQWLPKSVFGTILPLYGSLTAGCFFLLILTGIPAFDAFNLSMSTVSTGGFMPRDGALDLYGAPFALFVIAIFMAAGCVSLVWLRSLMQMRWVTVRASREPFWIAGTIGVVALYLVIISVASEHSLTPTAWFADVTVAVATSASHITTTGFPVSQTSHIHLPLVLVIALAFLGAGRYSTAGGIKFHRLGTMLRASGREFHHLVFPHAASSAPVPGSRPMVTTEGAVWANFFVVTGAVTALALYLSTYNLELAPSLLAAVSAIGNVGPAYELAQSSDIVNRPSYAEMPGGAKLALAVGMVFGRFEVLALLSLINIAYWRS